MSHPAEEDIAMQLPDITFAKVEPGWYRSSNGDQVIRRPFTGWRDDPDFPWLTPPHA